MNKLKIAFILTVFVGLMALPLQAQQPDTSNQAGQAPDTSAVQPATKIAADSGKTAPQDTTKAAVDTLRTSRQDTTEIPKTPVATAPDTTRIETTAVKAADSLKSAISETASQTSPEASPTPTPDTTIATPPQNTGSTTSSNPPTGSASQEEITRTAPTPPVAQTSQTQQQNVQESDRQPQLETAETDTVSEADSTPADSGAIVQSQPDEGGGIPGWLFWVAGLLIAGAIVTVVYLRRAKKEDDFFESPRTITIPEPKIKTPPQPVSESKLVLGRFIISQAQHEGGRQEQQDAFAISEPETESSHLGLLIVLADGMSGHAWGREASRAAVRTFQETYGAKSAEESITATLKRSLKAANETVITLARERQQENNVGTTLTAVVIENENLHWISVGDSRIYLFRESQLTQLTTDHIYLNKLSEQVSSGKLSKKEAAKHPDRDALYSFLGLKKVTEIDSNPKPYSLKNDDRILLCSEGVHKTLSKAEITEALAGNPDTLGDSIVRKALAKGNPEQENLTALVLVVK